jgi:hypothetical protein
MKITGDDEAIYGDVARTFKVRVVEGLGDVVQVPGRARSSAQ